MVHGQFADALRQDSPRAFIDAPGIAQTVGESKVHGRQVQREGVVLIGKREVAAVHHRTVHHPPPARAGSLRHLLTVQCESRDIHPQAVLPVANL